MHDFERKCLELELTLYNTIFDLLPSVEQIDIKALPDGPFRSEYIVKAMEMSALPNVKIITL